MMKYLDKILEAGVLAPSGSNSQPWEFRVKENRVDIIAIPGKDHPVLNFNYRGTWLAHGALIENILIAANYFGYNVKINLFPDKLEPNLTASLFFEHGYLDKEPLYDAISKRVTNRKPFLAKPLDPEIKDSLINTKIELASFKLIEDSKKIETIANAVSANEIIMFENKHLHSLLFKELVINREEEAKKGGGLYIKTMELNKIQEFALKYIFRYWPVMSLLNGLGFARKIAESNVTVYSSTPAMFAIETDSDDRAFINAGRLVERLWLKATLSGLSVHIITGIPFLYQKILAGETENFSQSHIKLIRDSYQEIVSACNSDTDRIIIAILRVGIGPEPSARSIKLPPKII